MKYYVELMEVDISPDYVSIVTSHIN